MEDLMYIRGASISARRKTTTLIKNAKAVDF